MKTRLILVVLLLAALAVAVGDHVRLRRAIAAAAAEHEAAQARLDGLRRNARSLEQEIAAIRAKQPALRQVRDASQATGGAAAARTTNTRRAPAKPTASTSQARTATIAMTPELRQLRVRAFVGEQRLAFADVLHRLALTPPQLQRFDAIQAEYQEAELDLAGSASAAGVTNPKELASLRRQLSTTRDAALRDLFGTNYAAWQEANRTQGIRATVGELLEQAFPSTGPIDNAQTEALTALVTRHARSGNGGYDWNAIDAELPAIVPGAPSAALKEAVALKRLSDQMHTLTTARN